MHVCVRACVRVCVWGGGGGGGGGGGQDAYYLEFEVHCSDVLHTGIIHHLF